MRVEWGCEKGKDVDEVGTTETTRISCGSYDGTVPRT